MICCQKEEYEIQFHAKINNKLFFGTFKVSKGRCNCLKGAVIVNLTAFEKV